MSVSLHDVHQALLQLGSLRFGEMNIEDAVHEIVRTTHTMFSVDGAGLMLVDAEQHLRNVAASDERLAHLENLQIQHQEGPCIAAYDGKELVGVEDLESDGRWPAFREHAVARRIRAVLASPLPYNQDAVGVVAVVSEQRHPWSPEAELALLAFTDLAALLIASMMQGQQQSELTAQLQEGLKSRQVIEQAKGVLMGRDGITPREAYVQLRAQARNERRKLVAVCTEIVKSSADGPAGRLRQGRTGSSANVVSAPPRILRLVVMSMLVSAAWPDSGPAAP
jgi:GAF domain-containing protein